MNTNVQTVQQDGEVRMPDESKNGTGLKYFRHEYSVDILDMQDFWSSVTNLFIIARAASLDLVIYKECDKIIVEAGEELYD